MITLNVVLWFKYILAGVILLGIGELIAFVIGGIFLLLQCFIEWDWFPIRSIEWVDIRSVMAFGILITLAMVVFMVAAV